MNASTPELLSRLRTTFPDATITEFPWGFRVEQTGDHLKLRTDFHFDASSAAAADAEEEESEEEEEDFTCDCCKQDVPQVFVYTHPEAEQLCDECSDRRDRDEEEDGEE